MPRSHAGSTANPTEHWPTCSKPLFRRFVVCACAPAPALAAAQQDVIKLISEAKGRDIGAGAQQGLQTVSTCKNRYFKAQTPRC